MKNIKTIIATIILYISISISSTIISHAYFSMKAQIVTDLKITTGNVGVYVDEGISTTLKPGEDTEYREFKIINTGSLSQNTEINFDNLNSQLKEYSQYITYQLQLRESEDTYTTVINGNLENLKNTVLNYSLNTEEELVFRYKLTIAQDIPEDIYDTDLNIRLKVKAHNRSFIDQTYQNNIIKIEKSDIDNESEYNFVTSAKTDNSDYTKITINLKGYFDIEQSFKFDIQEKFGYLKDKPFTSILNSNDDELDLNFKQNIDIDEISKEYPSQEKLDVEITYKKDNQIHKKLYTVEFTRQPIYEEDIQYSSEYLNIYFNEKN